MISAEKKQSTVKAAVQNRKRVIESDDDALVISSDSDEDSLQSVRYEPDMTNNDEDLDEFVVSGGEGEEELTEFLDEVRERAQGLMHHLKVCPLLHSQAQDRIADRLPIPRHRNSSSSSYSKSSPPIQTGSIRWRKNTHSKHHTLTFAMRSLR